MEYLAKDQNLEVGSYVKKKEEKLREFRQFLVDKEVVLSITKCNPLLVSHVLSSPTSFA